MALLSTKINVKKLHRIGTFLRKSLVWPRKMACLSWLGLLARPIGRLKSPTCNQALIEQCRSDDHIAHPKSHLMMHQR